jgi:hypothetical protein
VSHRHKNFFDTELNQLIMAKTTKRQGQKGPGTEFTNIQKQTDDAINERKETGPRGANRNAAAPGNSEYKPEGSTKKTGQTKQ